MSTVQSARLGQELHLGKTEATKLDPRTTRYAEVRPALIRAGVLPKIPQIFGHGHDFKQGEWLMLGNGPDDSVFKGFGGAGDCTIVEKAHVVMESQRNGGHKIAKFSGGGIIPQYSEVKERTGGEAYDPQSGSGDTGLNMQDVNNWMEEVGIADDSGHHHKSLHTIAIEPGNLLHIWEAAYLLEHVSLGVVICSAQMDQFDASPQPTWDYVKGSPEEGGHAVPVVGKVGLISWAEDVYFTPRFIEKQNDEAYSAVQPEIYHAATGETAEGYKSADIEKFLVLLAKSKLGV